MVRWLLLLAANEDQNLTDTLEAIALEQDETLQKAIQKWDNMSHNQQFRREYEAREKVLLDEKAAVAHAEKKGIEKGEARIIRKLYENGMTPQDIANHLGMYMADVQRILELS
ncbi:Rpn family recombination-promoting nuclease/putative transposase [Bacillus mycoides]|uniref:Rpn family recombination-promoting nuclease/putative transposase n=1 Tax=Bacillus mycoides TaxID=1405 RepID=UPI003D014F71